MDSARAEELLAGLGFNVDDSSPSPVTKGAGTSGRKRKRPRGSTGAQDPDSDRATTAAPAGNKVGYLDRLPLHSYVRSAQIRCSRGA